MAREFDQADLNEPSHRPSSLDEFIGQRGLCANLRVFVEAARTRGDALDHVLFHGPPGLGKTTLAQIVAREMGVGFCATSGPVIARPGDLAAILTNLKERDVLFIDEIHRLSKPVEEVLYPALDSRKLHLIVGKGPSARTLSIDLPPFTVIGATVRIDLPPFTLIGATTRSGLITNPLRERFGIPLRLLFYEVGELTEIVSRGARVLGVVLTVDGAREIARRSRGTPRVAGHLLRRVRDFAEVASDSAIDAHDADIALGRLGIDERGLDAMDRRYLSLIADNYGGGPVGVEAVAHTMNLTPDTLIDEVEPFLLRSELLIRTPRCRRLTVAGFDH
ncbi:hypothetical protein LCGC14_1573720, partial [marine sediment metagenome]